jgi:Flp pilus assembly protein TadD
VVLEKSGQRDKAVIDYRKALELDPTNALAQQGLRRLGG